MFSRWDKAVRCGLVLAFLCFICGNVLAKGRSRDTGEKKVKWVKSKHGLEALIDFSKDRGRMIEDYNDETHNYVAVMEAFLDGQLVKGTSKDEVRKRFGSPVIELPDRGGASEEWVYKPAAVSFFDKEKIYLIFDKEGNLSEWETIHPE